MLFIVYSRRKVWAATFGSRTTPVIPTNIVFCGFGNVRRAHGSHVVQWGRPQSAFNSSELEQHHFWSTGVHADRENLELLSETCELLEEALAINNDTGRYAGKTMDPRCVEAISSFCVSMVPIWSLCTHTGGPDDCRGPSKLATV